MYAGGASRGMASFGRLAPRVYDAILSKLGVKAQLTDEPRPDGGALYHSGMGLRERSGRHGRVRERSFYTDAHTLAADPRAALIGIAGVSVGRGSGPLTARGQRAPPVQIVKRPLDDACCPPIRWRHVVEAIRESSEMNVSALASMFQVPESGNVVMSARVRDETSSGSGRRLEEVRHANLHPRIARAICSDSAAELAAAAAATRRCDARRYDPVRGDQRRHTPPVVAHRGKGAKRQAHGARRGDS
jgi:hypothetical protein